MSAPVLLCIDDQPEVLRLRKTNLEAFGFSVEVATNVAAAMKSLEENSVLAVLVDYKCEGLDAQAVAYLIKQRHPDQRIILLSAYSEMPEAILWLVDEFVLKSEPVDRLVHLIERLAGLSQDRQSRAEKSIARRATAA
jgi:DNA-binding NtrC family response regulator